MATTAIIPSNSDVADYDRLTELKEFHDSKLGVKGLIDSGLRSIPRIFIHPKETLSDINTKSKPNNDVTSDIPTIDMSGSGDHRRSEIVEKIGRACRELGFFQVVNHGVPQEVMDGAIRGIKGFHEQAMEVKAELYHRDLTTEGGVSFSSNLDPSRSKAASWRDTIQMQLGGPQEIKAEQIPEICRKEMVEWNLHSKQVAELIMELMCEGLGLNPTKLKDLTCSAGRTLVGHYYPYCPQPDLTVGSASHTDPGVLTVLLQDQIGGLQAKHSDGWLDVEPVLGALVINVGDILQIMSNDEYKSVEHRVLANSGEEPRISMAIFFNPSDMEGICGPIPELISAENPPHYRYGYDRLKEVKQFDDSKVGVKDLVDLALTSIPKIFIHPKQTLSDIKSDKDHQNNNNNFVPMIDLSGERSAVVEQVARACREVGFSQVVNHGVQQDIGVKGFQAFGMCLLVVGHDENKANL